MTARLRHGGCRSPHAGQAADIVAVRKGRKIAAVKITEVAVAVCKDTRLLGTPS